MEMAKMLIPLLMIHTVSPTSLPLLLQDSISDAACLSQCQGVITTSQDRCFTSCKESQQDLPMLTVQSDGEELFNYFSLDSCQLAWSVQTQTSQNVVFVVSGQDQGGMWHLLAGNITANTWDISHRFGAKYPTVAIIAVNSYTVLDILKINIPPFQDCKHQEEDIKTIPGDVIIVIILAVIVLVLFIILLFIIICTRSSCKTREIPERDVEKKVVFDKTNKNRGRTLKFSSENTYVDCATVYEDVLVYA